MKYFLRLRHRMIPYLYTMNLRASQESIPLMQPLYYHQPMCIEAYQVKNEYYFGSELIACPVTEPADRETGMAQFKGWLPNGLWTDYYTGTVYEGNRWFTWYRGIDSIPVLMKEGGILVLDGRSQGNETDNPDTLEICVNTAGSGAFTLMEDDGQEAEYVESSWCRTTFKMENVVADDNGNTTDSKHFIILPAEGNLSIVPGERSYRIRFYGLDENGKLVVTVEGVEIQDFEVRYEKERGILEICLPQISVLKEIVVKLGSGKVHDNQKKERIFRYLNQAEIAFEDKESIYYKVSEIESGRKLTYVIGELQQLSLRKEILGPVMEILTACVDAQEDDGVYSVEN